MDIEWIRVSADKDQWERQISYFTYEFKEGDRKEIINILDYTEDEIENFISSSYTLYEPKEGKPNIVATCDNWTNFIIALYIYDAKKLSDENNKD